MDCIFGPRTNIERNANFSSLEHTRCLEPGGITSGESLQRRLAFISGNVEFT